MSQGMGMYGLLIVSQSCRAKKVACIIYGDQKSNRHATYLAILVIRLVAAGTINIDF
jgi:hypothetical protein